MYSNSLEYYYSVSPPPPPLAALQKETSRINNAVTYGEIMRFIYREGSATTPAHRCKDFLFRTYAPRAFKKFRKEFDIEADNFLVRV